MPEDFYKTYERFKTYQRLELSGKHIRWYDQEFWEPMDCDAAKSVLEIGCGTGHFLSYLKYKGVSHFTGIDLDPRVAGYLDQEIASHVRIIDAGDFISGQDGKRPFDRIAMLDVLEHFSPPDGVALLRGLKGVLAKNGLINVRVPNVSSPWGLKHQFGDLTHKAAYTPDSLRQASVAAGYEPVAFLPQLRGSPSRRIAENILNGVLSRMLTEAPAIWSANFIAILKLCPR